MTHQIEHTLGRTGGENLNSSHITIDLGGVAFRILNEYTQSEYYSLDAPNYICSGSTIKFQGLLTKPYIESSLFYREK
jgi:hypothetical protein